MTATHSLQAAFDALRESAQNFETIERWLADNPQALLGDITLPIGATVKTRLSFNCDSEISEALYQDRMLGKVTVEVCYTANVIANLRNNIRGEPSHYAILNHDWLFEMKLGEWPVACAYMVDKYIVLKHTKQGIAAGLREPLDRHIQTLFPAWTMDKLLGLVATGLLPTYADGELRGGFIRQMLLESRQGGPRVPQLPDQLSF